jgi:hypothetical protein
MYYVASMEYLQSMPYKQTGFASYGMLRFKAAILTGIYPELNTPH